MEIVNKRFAKGKNSSVGELSIDGKFFCFVIERLDKLIKDGEYPLIICNELTPLTQRHRMQATYKGWFEYHIEIDKVPGRDKLFFHIGNKWNDSMGCQLPCLRSFVENGDQVGYDSTPATKQFYALVYPLLKKGEKINYKIVSQYE